MIYNRLIVAAIGFIRLEPYDGKLSRTVLRGGKDSNALLLPDYASVEMLYHPEYAGKPLAVGGDPEARHGIVLTAIVAGKAGLPGFDICASEDGFIFEVFFNVARNIFGIYESS